MTPHRGGGAAGREEMLPVFAVKNAIEKYMNFTSRLNFHASGAAPDFSGVAEGGTPLNSFFGPPFLFFCFFCLRRFQISGIFLRFCEF